MSKFEEWMNSIGYTDEDMSMMYSGDLLGMKDAWNAGIDNLIQILALEAVSGTAIIHVGRGGFSTTSTKPVLLAEFADMGLIEALQIIKEPVPPMNSGGVNNAI